MADTAARTIAPPSKQRTGPPRPGFGHTIEQATQQTGIDQVQHSTTTVHSITGLASAKRASSTWIDRIASKERELAQSIKDLDGLTLAPVSASCRDWRVRQNLARDMSKGAAAKPDEQRVYMLQQLALTDKNMTVRSAATTQMSWLADSLGRSIVADPFLPRAYETLLELGRTRSAEVQKHALEALSALSVCTSTPVRQATADALGKVLASGADAPGSSTLLPKLSKDRYFFVRERAAFALGKALAADPSASGIRKALQDVASDQDSRVRASANDGLRRLTSALANILVEDPIAPGAFDTLMELARHPNAVVRQYSAPALCKVPVPAEKLRSKSASDKVSIEKTLYDAIAAKKSLAGEIDVARQALEQPAEALGGAVAKAKAKPKAAPKGGEPEVEAVDPKEKLKELEAQAKAAEETLTTSRAAMRLVKFENIESNRVAESAFESLLVLAKDSSRKVRQSAAKALGNLAVDYPKVPRLFAAVEDLMRDEDDTVQEVTAGVLGNAEGACSLSCLTILLKLAKDDSPRVRSHVAKALGVAYRKPGCSAQAIFVSLRKLLKDLINDVRSAASGSLRDVRVTATRDGERHAAVLKKMPDEDPLVKGRWTVVFELDALRVPTFTKYVEAAVADVLSLTADADPAEQVDGTTKLEEEQRTSEQKS